MTAKSPTGRFGIFFGLKRRPSSNFQNNADPLPPFYTAGAENDDPFAAHYVPSPVDVSTSRNLPQSASDLEHSLDIDIVYGDPPSTTTTDRPIRRPAPIDVFRPLRIEHPAEKLTDDDRWRVSRKDMAGTDVLGNPPLTLKHGGSATSVESLALAAAIAHANGMVLSPDPTNAASNHRKSAATPEYPSPPPSDHSSAYRSGVPSNTPRFPEEAEDEEEDVDQSLLVVGSAGNSSLPTTPALIDSFPATPYGPMPPYAPLPPQPQPELQLRALPTEALPIRASSRGARQRAGSTPALWSSSNSNSHYNTADLEVWDVAENDGPERDYIYPYSLRTLPVLGPPPSAPLPPEPLSPRLHSSSIYKHLHQLELDITSLTRKLTTTSTRSSGLQVSNPSTSDVPKMLKKAASHSRLQRESSGGTSGSSGFSNQALQYSASASTTAIPLTSSQSKMEAALQNAKRIRALAPPMPNLDNRSSFGQRPSTGATEACVVSPLKLKEKDRKASKDKDHPKEEKEKDGFPKRRFFSKYASMSSHVEKEGTAEISGIDLEDSRSVTSMQSGATGLPDDEWGANLGLAISSSLRTQESSINILPVSSASSQKSPIEDNSPLVTPQTPLRSHASPTEYVPKHILPPAELLRLERTGFALDEGMSDRGRDMRLGSPLSKSPLGTSPLASYMDWERRSTSASRVDVAYQPISITRTQRSGSFAVLSSAGTSTPGSPSQEGPSPSRMYPTRQGMPPRKYSDGSILSPPSKKAILRPVTSPSSPAGMGNGLSLPPPPRPRIKSFRSSSDLEHGSDVSSIADSVSGGLPPPPRTSRRPSTASNSSSLQSLAQKHRSILRKPSFLDIGDDDGRPSLEEVSEVAAPGHGANDRPLLDYLVSPASRSRSATISSNWTSSTLSTSRPTSRTTSRQATPISRQPTPTLRDSAAAAAAAEDSFLDMGKLSLDTIRSEDEESQAINSITVSVPRPAPKPWHTYHVKKPSIGSHF